MRTFRKIERFVDGHAVVNNVFGVATVISAIEAPGSIRTQLLLWLTVALVVFIPVRAAVARRGTPTGRLPLLMGSRSMPRIHVALAALIIDQRDGEAALSLVACTMMCVLAIGEQAMRRPVNSAAPAAANIPGWTVQLPSVALANWFYGINTVGMALLAVAASFGFTQLPALVCVGAAVVVGLVIGAQVIRYLVHRNRFEENLPLILDEMAPAFAFHWQAPAGTAYQAAMWLPYLARLGKPFFVLVRTTANFHEVAKLTDAPVILRSGLEDLDPIVCKSLKAVFYANTAVRNSHMIRFTNITHIQLNHGDSDKIASVSPTFRQYDKNFVAGQAAIDRFAKHGVATRLDQFVIVGRPQLEDVEIATSPISSHHPPTVLYSPTWSGFYEDSDYSSLIAGKGIVQGLLDRGCTVVFRPHPYARKHVTNAAACATIIELLTQDSKESGRPHVFGSQAETQWSIVDCMNASHAMVSDVSSVASDYLYSGKPLAMAAVSDHGAAFREQFPLAEAAYVIEVGADGSTAGLDEVLDDMLGPDSMSVKRLSLRTYYLSDTPAEHYAQRFLDEARKFIV
ncbi:MAG: CDP-glycerol glycerophosphotransferase family protein [Propionicimonas sp.]